MQARLGSGRQSLTDRPKSYRKRKNYFLKESFLFLKETNNFKIKVFFWLNIKSFIYFPKKSLIFCHKVLYILQKVLRKVLCFKESIIFNRIVLFSAKACHKYTSIYSYTKLF